MLSRAQRPLGVHVAAVISPDLAENHPFVSQLEAADVPTSCLQVSPRAYLEEYRRLASLIEHVRPRVVHTHGYRADVLASAVARAKGIPAVSTVHGFTGGGLRNRLYESVQRFALRYVDEVIAVSRPLVESLARSGIASSRLHFIQNGYENATPMIARARARARLGIPPEARVAAWVGRLSREKGPDVMIGALAKCDPSWRLSILGEGPDRVTLETQARKAGVDDRVTWHGLVDNAGTLLTAFDALVMSSRTEGTPITLFEAMNAGTPIVATRVGGIPDVVDSSQAILVPSEQPDAIASALDDIASDPNAAAQRSERARERLRAFDIAHWLAVVEEVYNLAIKCATPKSRR